MVKMKTAICLFGLAGGVNDKEGGLPVDFKLSYKSIKKHILDKNNCDVFIHSWSINYKDEIEKLYNPKNSYFQPQIAFHKPNFIYNFLSTEPKRLNNINSRWFSSWFANSLKKFYEGANGFTYDCVFTTRFDVSYCTDVKFNKFDLNKFYSAKNIKYCENGKEINNRDIRPQKRDLTKLTKKKIGYPYDDRGLLDYWFFSNSYNMDMFCNLYTHLPYYLDAIKKFNPFYRRLNMRIYNNHRIAIKHLKKIALLPKLDFAMELFTDFELTRRKYMGINR